jgi:FixJ family two-component response regulator
MQQVLSTISRGLTTAEYECMKAGSDAFITKPLTGASLRNAIERVLEKLKGANKKDA